MSRPQFVANTQEATVFADRVRALFMARQRADAELGRVLAEIHRVGPGIFGYGRVDRWLMDFLHLGQAEAETMDTRALALNPGRRNLDGSFEPALAPLTGIAAAEGVLGNTNLDLILKALAAIPREHHEDAEARLVAMAREAGPTEVRQVANQIVAYTNPDGPEPEEPARDPERRCRLHKKRNGRWQLDAEVEDTAGEFMNAVLDALSQRRTGEDGPDTRSVAQRHGDALVDAFDLAMNSPELPTQAGERVHVTVTLPLETLRSGVGKATLNLDQEISAWQARLWACDATIIPCCLGAKGEVLDLGRAKRLITPAQRRALYLRDRGCAFPGCKRPPRHCQGHHIVPWDHGGPTDLGNLVLLCAAHHRLLHRLAGTSGSHPTGSRNSCHRSGKTPTEDPGATTRTHPSPANPTGPAAGTRGSLPRPRPGSTTTDGKTYLSSASAVRRPQR